MTPDNEKVLIDPLKIAFTDMPMVIFEADCEGIVPFLIRELTGPWNHAMWLTPNGFASQGLTFEYVPVKNYMKKGFKLRFYKIKDLTNEERLAIYTIIEKRVNLPWWQKTYDFLGVFGQFIGIRLLNVPWLSYCSEQMASDITKTITPIKGKPTLSELEEIIKTIPRFVYVGEWAGGLKWT